MHVRLDSKQGEWVIGVKIRINSGLFASVPHPPFQGRENDVHRKEEERAYAPRNITDQLSENAAIRIPKFGDHGLRGRREG